MKKQYIIAIYVVLAVLLIICFPKSYAQHYNSGNKFYKKENYTEAINQYKESLEKNIPKNKECKVRINYALAICKTVNVDEKNQDSIKQAIETYESAINVLTEKSCDEHNDNAKQLKEDIQKEIDRLKQLLDKDEEEQDDEEDNEKDENENQTPEDIESKVQEQKQRATQEQRETESEYEHMGKEYKGGEKNW